GVGVGVEVTWLKPKSNVTVVFARAVTERVWLGSPLGAAVTFQLRSAPPAPSGTLVNVYRPNASVVAAPPNSVPTNTPDIGCPASRSVTVPLMVPVAVVGC